MKAILFIGTLCLVLFCSCDSTKAHPNKTELQFKDTINIGLVKFGDTTQVTQSVFNPTGDEIKITGISASCGCVVPSLSDSLIEPRQTSVITIDYIPSVSKDSGTFTKIVSFRTNSDLPLNTFYIKGEVKK